ncbi:hypothetical protein [Desulfosporosinus youngiae]|nr:hypothetical protein [Desulfosporosinus youngiae]
MYRITVGNGHFPLTYECATARDAYGCMETLATGLLHNVPIDMDEIMETIINIKKEFSLGIVTHYYSIEKVENIDPA